LIWASLKNATPQKPHLLPPIVVVDDQNDFQRKHYPHQRNWKGPQDDIEACFPPFYGVPASYKEIIRMAKKTSNCGYVVPHEKNMAQ
jgi:hypothetical protein